MNGGSRAPLFEGAEGVCKVFSGGREGRREASPSLVYGAALLMRFGDNPPSRVQIPQPPLPISKIAETPALAAGVSCVRHVCGKGLDGVSRATFRKIAERVFPQLRRGAENRFRLWAPFM